jgi:hypothetical protein
LELYTVQLVMKFGAMRHFVCSSKLLTSASNGKIQLAVFTPFNILANYFFPLKRAL